MSDAGARGDAEPVVDSGPGAFLRRHRRRIATIAMIALLMLLATHGSRVLPSTLTLSIPLSDRASLRRVEVTLRDPAGEEALRTVRTFSGDAPEAIEVSAELLPMAYELEVRTEREPGGERVLHGSVDVPSEGTVRPRLE